MRQTLVMCTVLAATVSASPGQSRIDVGTHLVQSAPGQTIRIEVTGGERVDAMEFVARIGDGEGVAPVFDCIDPADVLAGGVFGDHVDGVMDGYLIEQDYYLGLLTPAGTTVKAEGLLVTLTVDASHFREGERFPLSLTSEIEETTTHFGGTPIAITDGWIEVIPEPATSVILLAGAGLLAGRRTRRRRCNGP
jgi:hypothetical protein